MTLLRPRPLPYTTHQTVYKPNLLRRRYLLRGFNSEFIIKSTMFGDQ